MSLGGTVFDFIGIFATMLAGRSNRKLESSPLVASRACSFGDVRLEPWSFAAASFWSAVASVARHRFGAVHKPFRWIILAALIGTPKVPAAYLRSARSFVYRFILINTALQRGVHRQPPVPRPDLDRHLL
jgi:hypothetical protein